MYSNYNMPQNYTNMYPRGQNFQNNLPMNEDERFIGGGFLAPLLLGGVAGYAIGRPNNNYPPYNNYYYQNYYGPYPYYYYY